MFGSEQLAETSLTQIGTWDSTGGRMRRRMMGSFLPQPPPVTGMFGMYPRFVYNYPRANIIGLLSVVQRQQVVLMLHRVCRSGARHIDS